MNPSRSNLGQCITVAGPDVVSAGYFLIVWFSPFAFGDDTVRQAMLVMIIEFILIHAAGFLGAFGFSYGMPPIKRLVSFGGFSLIYGSFIALFVTIFESWWPALAFGWLLIAKLSGVLSRRGIDRHERERQTTMWSMSALFYILGVVITVLLPLPTFGLDASLLERFNLPGSGLWVDKPHRVIAFGVLYFGALAALKFTEERRVSIHQ